MTPWMIFIAGSLLLTLVVVGGILLRHSYPQVPKTIKPAEDARIFYLLLWLAWLSIMAYIAFAFGKR